MSVFGLGYVGCVSAACLAQDGHTVIGVDTDERKVCAINDGQAPFVEPQLDEILHAARTRGDLYATTNEVDAMRETDLALICVGTPSTRTGEIKLDALRAVLTSIGTALKTRETPFIVVLRSTVLPHIVEHELIPLLERSSGRTLGSQMQFCYNPEFLREGTAIKDFYEAPMVIVGGNGGWAGETVAQLYSKVQAPIIHTDIGTAALVKYVCNVFHALKVSFANEVGQLSDALSVDGRRVMELMCLDTKLNISSAYMKPGFAFGGSCLPKDLRAIVAEARLRGLSLPVVQGILPSNERHLHSCIETVLGLGGRAVGLFGLTFKDDTDDLRESPAVGLAEALLGKGVDVKIYEPAISQGSIHGANLDYLERSIPHVWRLLTNNLSEMVQHCNAVVVLKKVSPQEQAILQCMSDSQVCIDYTGSISQSELRARLLTFAVPSAELALR